ncbi:uncharacterized protein [Nicotiana sylvestris]|uniref:uncharacterized protein n=1 Tax=Nicotiana sylvestris TaxID=4096 RepID=UPI00388C4372
MTPHKFLDLLSISREVQDMNLAQGFCTFYFLYRCYRNPRGFEMPDTGLIHSGNKDKWETWRGLAFIVAFMGANYKATISKLEGKIRDLKFDKSVQATADEGEKKKLAKENDALRAQIREMKIAGKNPARSAKDEKLIDNLRRKVGEYGFDLNKTEGELASARTKLAKNAEERACLVKQLKEKYDNEVMKLKKKITILENKMAKQAKDFKAEREHYYASMSQFEKDLQQLQEQNHTTEQILEARIQQIGRLLQEKGIIRERVRRIADYITMKCSECEDMTRSMFFTTVMIFARQIMEDLYHFQGFVVESQYRSKNKLIMANEELDASVIDPAREVEESDVNLKEEFYKLK